MGSKNPLQLAHSGYHDTKILGTKVWGGSLDFNLYRKLHKSEPPPMLMEASIYLGKLKELAAQLNGSRYNETLIL